MAFDLPHRLGSHNEIRFGNSPEDYSQDGVSWKLTSGEFPNSNSCVGPSPWVAERRSPTRV